MLYQAVASFLRETDEDVSDAAAVTAILLAEHPALAGHREHLVPSARRILANGNNDADRHVAWRALKAWGQDVPEADPWEEEPHDWEPHSDGRGDLEPPF
ncbi:hypothetical protein SRB5_06420 [Streptomyces sp. RB5]|uniref:HEAT repeat domain-containing protein n=1 Tax=Streptomyces smaragdinus TaxID=2585196 RepID=A0A7K0CCP4_9ACTN|nr:hypothetical protein [Streptomyces smaragdinus]MQY10534.1 hypothetical protein [Streptomyces smaragdinus]